MNRKPKKVLIFFLEREREENGKITNHIGLNDFRLPDLKKKYLFIYYYR